MTHKLISGLISYFGHDARRINHALKVYAFAKGIADTEGMKDDELIIIEAAALLHDIGIKNSERLYNSSAGHYQEQEGPPVAREILFGLGFDNTITERVCFLIGHHHSYSKIDGLDFQILVEADFLVNIYEDEMDAGQASKICDKYFKTQSGAAMLNHMYL